jgi:hypothetical protein
LVARATTVIIGIVIGVIATVSLIAYVGSIGASNNQANSGGGLPNPYVNRVYGFTVQYPQGWKGYENFKLDSNTISVVTFFAPNASISVVAETIPAGQTFDSIDANSEKADIGVHTGYTMLLQSSGQGTIGGVPANVRIWLKKTPQGEYQEETFHFLHLGRIYSVGFVAPAAIYNNEVGQFNQFLRTFSFI